MDSMEKGGHGGGHEKKHESHEGHAGKHSKWMEHAINGLKAVGIGFGIIAFAPALLSAAAVILPQYMSWIGVGAAAVYLDKKYSAPKDKHAGPHGGH
jgi:hypothetical protein